MKGFERRNYRARIAGARVREVDQRIAANAHLAEQDAGVDVARSCVMCRREFELPLMRQFDRQLALIGRSIEQCRP